MHLPDYKLRFEHPELVGLEVVMGRLTIEELFEFNDLLESAPAAPEPPVDAKTRQEFRKKLKAYRADLIAFIGKHTVSWNLTDRDGAPVPLGQITDIVLLGGIQEGWLEAINGAADPLARTAAIEAAIPVEALPSDAQPAPAG